MVKQLTVIFALSFSFLLHASAELCSDQSVLHYSGVEVGAAKALCEDAGSGVFSNEGGICSCKERQDEVLCRQGDKSLQFKPLSEARKQCAEEGSFLVFKSRGGKCSCESKVAEISCLSGEYSGLFREIAREKCVSAANKRFSYDSGKCACYDVKDCSYQLKIVSDEQDFSDKVFGCDQYNNFVLEDSYSYKNPLDALAEAGNKIDDKNSEASKKVSKILCDDINSKIDPLQRSVLIEKECAEQLKAERAKGKEIKNIDFIVQVDGIECGTRISFDSSKVEIQDLGDTFPSNVISIDPAKYGPCQNGVSKVLDKEVIDYLEQYQISCDDRQKIQQAYNTLKAYLDASLKQGLKKQLDEAVASGIPKEKALMDIFSTFQIPIKVEGYASAVDTTTKYSNFDLSSKRGEETVKTFKKLVGGMLQDMMKENGIKDLKINLDERVKIIPEQSKYGPMGPIGYVNTEKSFDIALKELASSNPRVAKCQSNKTGEEYKQEIFACTLYAHLTYNCSGLDATKFRECNGQGLFKKVPKGTGRAVMMPLEQFMDVFKTVRELHKNKEFDQVDKFFEMGQDSQQAAANKLEAVIKSERGQGLVKEVGRNQVLSLMVSFLDKDKKAFDRYKYFSVDANVIYTKEVKADGKKTGDSFVCKITAPSDVKVAEPVGKLDLHDFINDEDKENLYSYVPAQQKKDFLVNGNVDRYIVTPKASLKTFFNKDCVQAKKRMKKHYIQTFGKEGWKRAFKNDKTRYNNLSYDGPNRQIAFDKINGDLNDYTANKLTRQNIPTGDALSMKEDPQVLKAREDLKKIYKDNEALVDYGRKENELNRLKAELENMNNIFPNLIPKDEDITVIIDTSGSMSGVTAEETGTQTKDLIKKLNTYKGANQKLNIILTNGQKDTLLKSAEPATPDLKEKAKKFVNPTGFGMGASELTKPLEHAINDRNTNTVYVLTDAELFDYDDIRNLLPSIASSKRKIHTIVLGNSMMSGKPNSDVQEVDFTRVRGEQALATADKVEKFLSKKIPELETQKKAIEEKAKAGPLAPADKAELQKLELAIGKFKTLALDAAKTKKQAKEWTYEQGLKASKEGVTVKNAYSPALTDAETFDAISKMSGGTTRTIPYFFSMGERQKVIAQEMEKVQKEMSELESSLAPDIKQKVENAQSKLKAAEDAQDKKWQELKEKKGFKAQ